MSIYDDFQALANQLLASAADDPNAFGQGTIVYVATTQTDDVTDPWEVSAETETETTLNAVASGVPDKMVDGKDITAADILVTSGIAAGLSPKTGDTIKIDGTEYRIGKVMTIPAAGTPVVWKFVVKT